MNESQRDARWNELRTAVDNVMDRDLRTSQARGIARAAFVARGNAKGTNAKLRSSLRDNLGRRAATALAIAAGVLLYFHLHRKPPSDSLVFHIGASTEPGRVGARITTDTTRTPIRFSDGTDMTLDSHTEARVLDVSTHGAGILVERGTAVMSVVHRDAQTRWTLAAGPFDVDVTGTLFAVTWEPTTGAFQLRLDEGSVVVRGCGTPPTPVRAGETLSRRCEANETDPAPSFAEPNLPPQKAHVEDAPPQIARPRASVADAALDANTTALVEAPDAGVTAHATWRARYRQGDFALAFEEARSTFEDICEHASPDDVLALADAARLSRHKDFAQRALARLRARFPDTREALMAAFYLGVMAFEEGDFTRAATAFETCLEEDHRHELSREASGRLLETRERLGEPTRLRASADAYLRAFPDGPLADRARRITRTLP